MRDGYANPLKKGVILPVLRTKKYYNPMNSFQLASTVTDHPVQKQSTLSRLFLSTRARRSPLSVISNNDGMEYGTYNANSNYTSSVSNPSYYQVRLPFYHVYDQ